MIDKEIQNQSILFMEYLMMEHLVRISEVLDQLKNLP